VAGFGFLTLSHVTIPGPGGSQPGREAIGCWLLAIGYWLLAVGYWLLAVGCWLLAMGLGLWLGYRGSQ
jgi:hypothetical protein